MLRASAELDRESRISVRRTNVRLNTTIDGAMDAYMLSEKATVIDNLVRAALTSSSISKAAGNSGPA